MRIIFKNPSSHLLRSFALIALFLTSACSTVMEGSNQKIAVNSVPEGASCILKANDEVVGEVSQTPATVIVAKSKYDIVVECTKDGYLKGKNKNHSDYAISGITNAVFGQFGVMGSMVDNASGAGNKYDSKVFVELEKAPAATSAPVVAQASVTPVVEKVYQVMPVQYVYQAAIAPTNYVPAVSIQPVTQIADASVSDAITDVRKPPFNMEQ